MRIRLERGWTEKLLKLPESGMGYQRVDITLEDGRKLSNVVVVNAEFIELSDCIGPSKIVDIRLHRDIK